MKTILTVVMSVSVLAMSAGCEMMTKTKKLEQENAELKDSLGQVTQQLEEANARNKTSDQALTAALAKHDKLSKKIADLEAAKTELRKQWTATRNRLNKQQAEANMQKQLAEKHQNKVRTLTRQLDEANKRIATLEAKITELQKQRAENRPTQPVETQE